MRSSAAPDRASWIGASSGRPEGAFNNNRRNSDQGLSAEKARARRLCELGARRPSAPSRLIRNGAPYYTSASPKSRAGHLQRRLYSPPTRKGFLPEMHRWSPRCRRIRTDEHRIPRAPGRWLPGAAACASAGMAAGQRGTTPRHVSEFGLLACDRRRTATGWPTGRNRTRLEPWKPTIAGRGLSTRTRILFKDRSLFSRPAAAAVSARWRQPCCSAPGATRLRTRKRVRVPGVDPVPEPQPS